LQNNDVIEIGKYKMKYVVDSTTAAVVGPAQAEDFEKTMVMRAPKSVPAPKPAPAAPAPAPAAPKPVAAPPPAPAASAAAAPKPVAPAAAPAPTPPPAAPKPSTPAAAPAAAPKPAGAAEGHPLGALQILTGASAGREIELTKNLTTLGKPGLQVAVITRRSQGYFLTHVEGASFPVINGKTLDNQARALSDHDVIELAGVKMEFFVKK